MCALVVVSMTSLAKGSTYSYIFQKKQPRPLSAALRLWRDQAWQMPVVPFVRK